MGVGRTERNISTPVATTNPTMTAVQSQPGNRPEPGGSSNIRRGVSFIGKDGAIIYHRSRGQDTKFGFQLPG